MKGITRLGIAAALAVQAAACGDSSPLSANAELEVEPLSIDFGQVPTGESRSLEIHLRNRAPSGVLTVKRVALAEGSASVFSLTGVPMRIPARQAATVLVHYTPIGAEPSAGTIEIESNTITGMTAKVAIRSARTFPHLAVDPKMLDLGSVLNGGMASRNVRLTNRGNATLAFSRLSLRTAGFAGEACAADADCRQGRCTPSRSGAICALPCSDSGSTCPAGYLCTTGPDGYRGCREDEHTPPPLAARGFSLAADGLPKLGDLLPGRQSEIQVLYLPSPTDRGSAQLLIESNDADQPEVVVPLTGRPEHLPPVAAASLDPSSPRTIEPGSRVLLSSEGSYDPEGTAITYDWSFVLRPEGSRAIVIDRRAPAAAFAVDLPGRYIVQLHVRNAAGLSSTNDARVELDATAGERVRAVLTWDRRESELDLHFIAPGAPLGSSGDCFFDNPRPHWHSPGSDGNPVLTATAASQSIGVTRPSPGVYTLVVRMITPSAYGPTAGTLRIFLNDVEVSVFEQRLSPPSEQWDVATLTWPSGRLAPLGSIH